MKFQYLSIVKYFIYKSRMDYKITFELTYFFIINLLICKIKLRYIKINKYNINNNKIYIIIN